MSGESFAVRIQRLLVAMQLLPDAGAIDYSRVQIGKPKGGHGSHAKRSAPPRADSLALDWDRRFSRLVRLAEQELSDYKTGKRRPDGSETRASRDRRLASYVDEAPSFVAYVEDMSTEGVRKWRQRNNRDPESGRRLPKINAPRED